MARTESQLEGLTLLGNNATEYLDRYSLEVLETFDTA